MPNINIRKKGNPGVSPVKNRLVSQQTTGFGYIMIPEGVDRDKFVETCFRKNRVSIVDDSNGNVVHDCYITNEALQNVYFPRLTGEKGIPVVWVSQPFLTEPMIIGTFLPQERISVRDDEEFVINRQWDKGILTISGSAKDGSLFINVRGQESGYIKVSSDGDENSVIDVVSTGSIKATANENLEGVSFKNLIAKVIDPELGNESGISVNKDSFLVSATYGEEGEKNIFKTNITTQGLKTELNFYEGNSAFFEITKNFVEFSSSFKDNLYQNVINKDMALIQFQDSLVKLENEKATLMQGDAFLEIMKGKLAMMNGATGLLELLTRITTAIKSMQVQTNSGPSGLPLPSIIQMTSEVEELLSKFFNK